MPLIYITSPAGKQAEVLNILLEDLLEGHAVSETKLKEVLGHTPIQVHTLHKINRKHAVTHIDTLLHEVSGCVTHRGSHILCNVVLYWGNSPALFCLATDNPSVQHVIFNADVGLVCAGVCGCSSWGPGGGLLSHSCSHGSCLTVACSDHDIYICSIRPVSISTLSDTYSKAA